MNIENGLSNPIDFYIDATKFLQVLTSGNTNVVSGSNGYLINDQFVLWHNNQPSNIFVGVDAGNSTMSGVSNTLVGEGAGLSLTSSNGNTAVGESAATSITTGDHNTAIGYDALSSAVDLKWNTAVGYQALGLGASCPSCYQNQSYNTAVGYQALMNSQVYG